MTVPLRVKAPQGPLDIRQILVSFLLLLPTIIMPHEYQAEVKIKFPLPEYPQEGQYEDPIVGRIIIICHMNHLWSPVPGPGGAIITILNLVFIPLCKTWK